MIRAYTQRLLPPYSGVVQVAETTRARAVSFDGIHWNIQYFSGNERSSDNAFRVQGYGLDRGYFDVARLNKQQLNTFNFPACVDHDAVSACITELHDYLATAQSPFPLQDKFEYWLLDSRDDSPLALIYACCDESLMDSYPAKTEWMALPHSKLPVENTESEQARNETPVNHRLQHLIARRAGSNPRAAWFERNGSGNEGFPNLLIREDWHDEAEHELCQRYLMRKAPRLLMLHDLTTDERERLEVAAKQHVFEVEEYYALYPEVNDQRRLSAMRVEAHLRRSAPQATKSTGQKKPAGPSELSKDMRIIEN